ERGCDTQVDTGEMLANAKPCPWVAAMKRARSSRASARRGAVFGSTKARRIVENVDFALPCSPETATTGYGPVLRNAASSQATVNTKSLSVTLRNFRNASPRT